MTQQPLMTVVDAYVPRPRRGRPPQVQFWAGKVFQHIPASSTNTWIHAKDLAKISGLTLDQVYRSVAYLRDNFPDFPLVSDITRGYRFTVDEEQVAEFRRYRARVATTIIERTFKGAVEPMLRNSNANPRDVRRVEKDFKRLMEDIADIVAA